MSLLSKIYGLNKPKKKLQTDTPQQNIYTAIQLKKDSIPTTQEDTVLMSSKNKSYNKNKPIKKEFKIS